MTSQDSVEQEQKSVEAGANRDSLACRDRGGNRLNGRFGRLSAVRPAHAP